jgi:hypothetical protein
LVGRSVGRADGLFADEHDDDDGVCVFQQALDAARKKALDLVKTAGNVTRTRYKLMTSERYKTKYGKTPKEAGLSTFEKKIDGIMLEVVAVRVTPEGEWEFDVEEAARTELKESIDDGSNVLRLGQQDDKFLQLQNELKNNIDEFAVDQADLEDDDAGEEEEEEEKSDSEKSHDSLEDEEDFVLTMCGSGKSSGVGRAAAGKGKAKSSAKSSKSSGSAKAGASGKTKKNHVKGSQSSQVQTPVKAKKGVAEATSEKSPEKEALAKSDVAISPKKDQVDPNSYLEQNGWLELVEKFKTVQKGWNEEVFKAADVKTLTPDGCKALVKKLAETCFDSKKLNAEIINFLWKIKKRSKYPPGCVAIMDTERKMVQTFWNACQNFQLGHGFDAPKWEKHRAELRKVLEELPPVFELLYWRQKLQNDIRHVRFRDFALRLTFQVEDDVSLAVDMSGKTKLAMHICETTLIESWISIDSDANHVDQMEALQRSADIMKEVVKVGNQPMIEKPFVTDLGYLILSMDDSEETTPDDQTAAWAHVQAKQKDESYAGVFKALESSGKQKMIASLVDKSVEKKAAAQGPKGMLVTVGRLTVKVLDFEQDFTTADRKLSIDSVKVFLARCSEGDKETKSKYRELVPKIFKGRHVRS